MIDTEQALIRYTYETTDNRHRKRYTAEIEVYMTTPFGRGDVDWKEFCRVVRKKAKKEFGLVVSPTSSRDYSAKEGCLIGFDVESKYGRPSLTPKTYEDWVKDLGYNGILSFHGKAELILLAALCKGVHSQKQIRHRQKVTADANDMLSDLVNKIQDIAGKQCEYAERYKALDLEYAAEIQMVVGHVLDDLDTLRFTDGRKPTVEALAAVRANLAKYAAPGGRDEHFLPEHPTQLGVSDVFPDQ